MHDNRLVNCSKQTTMTPRVVCRETSEIGRGRVFLLVLKILDGKASTSRPASSTNLSRPWFYQTCTEFGWYQSSSQKGHPFGSTFPLGADIKGLWVSFFTVLPLQGCSQRCVRTYLGQNLLRNFSKGVLRCFQFF